MNKDVVQTTVGIQPTNDHLLPSIAASQRTTCASAASRWSGVRLDYFLQAADGWTSDGHLNEPQSLSVPARDHDPSLRVRALLKVSSFPSPSEAVG